MDRKTKIGIIGCGQISDAYFKALTAFDNVEITACADLNMEAATAKSETYRIKAVTVDELLADPEITIVVNLTVPEAHAEVAVKTLRAGKHAYAEKPLAVSASDARRVLELAAGKKLRVGCAPDTFLGGGQQTSRKLIDDGWIGRPVAGTAFFMGYGPERYYHQTPAFFYKTGGGPMFDLGVYSITALVSLLGPAKGVSAIVSKGFEYRIAGPQSLKPYEKLPVEVPTHYSGSIEFHTGAVITLVASFDVWAHQHKPIEIYGTHGSIEVPNPNTFGGPVRLAVGDQPDVEWSDCPVTHQYTGNMRGLGVADMAKAIATGRQHRASGKLAFHVLEIMEAFEKSSRTGQYVELQSSCDRPAPLPVGLRFGELD
ncbi:MAG: Gfo/Idh/MocA family oxidoreductase [Victivallaceae bacterium]|nr:Gfo/Idh/MocA family oxidoreductase [Victivallaceae bacterium]